MADSWTINADATRYEERLGMTLAKYLISCFIAIVSLAPGYFFLISFHQLLDDLDIKEAGSIILVFGLFLFRATRCLSSAFLSPLQ